MSRCKEDEKNLSSVFTFVDKYYIYLYRTPFFISKNPNFRIKFSGVYCLPLGGSSELGTIPQTCVDIDYRRGPHSGPKRCKIDQNFSRDLLRTFKSHQSAQLPGRGLEQTLPPLHGSPQLMHNNVDYMWIFVRYA